MEVKIAVVQFKIKQYCQEENLSKAEEFIKNASISGADIIVFPEDFITGPVCKRKEFVDFNNSYRNHFQKLAAKYKIDIVTGSFIEGEDQGWFNTSYYMDYKGNVLNRYRKVNLWKEERQYLNPGNQVKVFNTRFGKSAILICWDLSFPEIFRKLVQQKVEIVYIPSFWCVSDAGEGINIDSSSEIKFVNSCCVARAFENEIILVYANAAGKFELPTFTDNLIGQSQIAVPFIGPIKKLNHNNEEMFIEEVNISILTKAEKSYSIRKDLRERVL